MPLPVSEYEELAAQMLEIYDQAELVMIRRVANRLARGISSPGWTERKLAETGAVRRQLQQTLAGLRASRVGQAETAIAAGYEGGQAWFFADAAEYALAVGTQHISPSSARVAAILSDLNHRLDAADRAILRRADDAYADVIAQVSALAATGTVTTREAVSRAVQVFADRGISSFVDSAGRSWEMGTYAEMATLTAIEQASVTGYTETMEKYGYDLAMISSHEDACPVCAAWQGVIVSVSGKSRKYPSLDDAYAAGVFHPRCMHHLSIWHEGITHGEARSRPRRMQPPSAGYTARSRQRYCERQIRRYKRRQTAAVSPQEERAAKAYVTKWQREIREHIADAPVTLRRQYTREGGQVRLSQAARELPSLKIYPSGRIAQAIRWTDGHRAPKPAGQTPYAAIARHGAGHTDILYLYDRDGRVIMHIDNGPHGNQKQHTFVDEQGKTTHQHVHLARWREDGSFAGYGNIEQARAVTAAMRMDFPELLKGED